jgi:virginiamycin B lyase
MFATVSANTGPVGLALASDGNVYWTEGSKGALGYRFFGGVGETLVGGTPNGIVSAPDGNLWYADAGLNQIVQFSPTSKTVLNRYLTTPGGMPVALALGKDGALWFTENNAGKIGRITMSGAITEYPMPSASSSIIGVGVGPDGSIWVTEAMAGKIARLVY